MYKLETFICINSLVKIDSFMLSKFIFNYKNLSKIYTQNYQDPVKMLKLNELDLNLFNTHYLNRIKDSAFINSNILIILSENQINYLPILKYI
jgi:hypothetical protein